MIAQVYPIRRSPRRLGFFDYRIPDDMDVSTGDMVEISLRRNRIRGIVRNVSKTSNFKRLSSVEGIVSKNMLSESDIQRIEWIADEILQSPANLFYVMYRHYRPDDDKEDATPKTTSPLTYSRRDISEAQSDKKCVHLRSQLIRLHEYISHTKNQVLIICPNDELAHWISLQLAASHNVHTLTGKTKRAIASTIIQKWRSGSIQVLVGTRVASLLPGHDIDHVIVMHPNSSEYQMLDQNPRYHAVHSARKLSDQYNTKYTELGYYRSPHAHPIKGESIPLIDMHAPNEKTDVFWLSQTAQSKIEKTIKQGKKAVLIYNRKGAAKILECHDCGHIPFCAGCGNAPTVRIHDLACTICNVEMYKPPQCPACSSKKMKEKGIGNEAIADRIQKLFNVKSSVYDALHTDLNANIIVATEYFFKHYHKHLQQNIGSLIELRSELHLFPPGIDSKHELRYKLARSRLVSEDLRASFLCQTGTFDSTQHALSFEAELEEYQDRRSLQIPPFGKRIRIKLPSSDIPEPLRALDFIQESDTLLLQISTDAWPHVKKILKSLPDSIIITNETPYEPNSSTTSSK